MKAQITTLLTSSLLLLTSLLQPTYAAQGAKNMVVTPTC